jgi:stigma-specific protein Stig1
VLRLIGGAVVAAAVPTLRPRSALGRSLRPQLSTACPPTCAEPFPFVCSCPGATPGTCLNQCGVAGSTCCCFGTAGAAACPPGTRCGRPGEQTCPCVGTKCASGCCKDGEECCANTRCCKLNEECVTFRVGIVGGGVCVARCPQGRARCGPQKCCPTNWRCANPARGLCKRCKANQEECGTKCCDKKTSRCCANQLCCRKGRACCTVGGKRTCCPPNTKCTLQITPGNIGLTPDSSRVCCPKPRYVPNPGLCCPPGKVALTDPGQRVGPGLEPYCCANDQVCRSGSTITCCQKSAVLGSETCCSGKCVDIRFDAQNCGSCGNVCASGVCREGICALP